MIIYKTTDRISVKVDSLVFQISPLTQAEKSELQTHMFKAVNGNMEEAMKGVRKSMAFGIKEIKGLKVHNEAGELVDYELSFENGVLSDECLDDLMNLSVSQKISSVCSAFINGVPEKVVDGNGNDLEGVSIIPRKATRKKK